MPVGAALSTLASLIYLACAQWPWLRFVANDALDLVLRTGRAGRRYYQPETMAR